jgi:hypothetical protein
MKNVFNSVGYPPHFKDYQAVSQGSSTLRLKPNGKADILIDLLHRDPAVPTWRAE